MAKPEKTGKKSMTEILMGGSLKGTALLSNSDLMLSPKFVKTRVPLINVALCGDIDGGLSYGFNQIAGPSRHFKTSFGLVMVKAFLDKDPENMVVFYDSEFGAKQQYLTNFGIDGSRVVYIPIMNIEELKFDISGKLEALEKDAKVMFFIDSIGNLASKKEIEDALAEKSAADMTRAKALKGLGRIVTPQLNYKRIPLVAINHTYKTMEMFSKDVVSGGTGTMYVSDIVWIIGRSQDKNDSTGEMDGYYFTINIDKSRFVKEKSKFAIRVGWEGGIARWSGMADLAEEFDIIKSGRGAKNKKIWEFVDKDGVVHETFDSEVDVDDEFWERIIKETNIGELISKKFKI